MEVYPSVEKMKKTLGYASDPGIPYSLIVGSREWESQQFSLKDLATGQQESLNKDELILRLQSK